MVIKNAKSNTVMEASTLFAMFNFCLTEHLWMVSANAWCQRKTCLIPNNNYLKQFKPCVLVSIYTQYSRPVKLEWLQTVLASVISELDEALLSLRNFIKKTSSPCDRDGVSTESFRADAHLMSSALVRSLEEGHPLDDYWYRCCRNGGEDSYATLQNKAFGSPQDVVFICNEESKVCARSRKHGPRDARAYCSHRCSIHIHRKTLRKEGYEQNYPFNWKRFCVTDNKVKSRLVCQLRRYAATNPGNITWIKAGFHALEVWGEQLLDSCIRFLNEDPWERLHLRSS